MKNSTNISVRLPAPFLEKVDRIRDDLQADALPGQTYTRTDVILWAIEALFDGSVREDGTASSDDLDMSEPHPVD